MPLRRQVPGSEAMRAHVFAPSSDPAKSAFFLVSGIGRIAFSSPLVSISSRPSVRKRVSPAQRFSPYRMFRVSSFVEESCCRQPSSQGRRASTIGLKNLSRIFKRVAGSQPRIPFRWRKAAQCARPSRRRFPTAYPWRTW